MIEPVRVRGFAALGRWGPGARGLARLGIVASLGDTSAPVQAWSLTISRWVTDPVALREWLEQVSGGRVVQGHLNSDATASVVLDDGHGAELAEVGDLHDGPQQLLLDDGVVVVGPALARWWRSYAT